MKNDTVVVRIARDKHLQLGKSKNLKMTWDAFCKMFASPMRSSENFETYQNADAESRNRLKRINGWYLGGHTEKGVRRKAAIRERDLVILDLDVLSPDFFDKIKKGLPGILPYEYLGYTTRSHSPKGPKLRLHFLLSKPIEAEKYPAISRLIAHKIDPAMDAVDDISFRVAQMMFMPTASADQDFHSWRNPGVPLDPDSLLSEWGGDWTDHNELPHSKTRGSKRPTAEKAEDPWEKTGPIGAFCRAWPIPEAIDQFIRGTYTPSDIPSEKPRYTYVPGTTANGAVVEDDGRFLYSHHGSDPCSDTLVNSFDLIRIHLFGDKDGDTDGQDVKGLPSYQAMMKLVLNDDRTKDELLAEEIGIIEGFESLDPLKPESDVAAEIRNLFKDPEDDEDDELLAGLPPYPGTAKPPKVRSKWWRSLELTPTNQIKCTLPNISKILLSDASLYGIIARNLFNGHICAKGSFQSNLESVFPIFVPDPEDGLAWTNDHDIAVRTLLEEQRKKGVGGYGMRVPDRDVAAGIRRASFEWRYHPIIDRLLALPKWDGKKRVERLWIDYLGTADSPYHRETAKQFLTGAIARLYWPGHKFDFIPIIGGSQGRRKSTFVSVLFYDKWSRELTVEMTTNKDSVEQMLGVWCLELAELASMSYGAIEAQKAFVSRTQDRVRLAYERRMQTFPRQCVFCGTSNPTEYLKDDENRRYWPIDVIADPIDTDLLESERDQIWSEALRLYAALCRQGNYRKLTFGLTGEALEEALYRQAAARTETRNDEYRAVIESWLERPTPVSIILGDNDFGRLCQEDQVGLRVKTCTQQIRDHILLELGIAPKDRQGLERVISSLMNRMPGWSRPEYGQGSAKSDKIIIPGFGKRRGWILMKATRHELRQGYKPCRDEISELFYEVPKAKTGGY